MATSPVFEGSCACGSVTWKSSQNATHLDACYCRQCQKISGAPVIYWMGVPESTLTIDGRLGILRLSDLATRGFCKDCGGTLFMHYTCYPEKTHLTAATTARNDFGMPTLGAHIFVRSKPEWYTIAEDGIPRWDDWDDEFATKFPDVVTQWRHSERTKT